MNNKNFTIKISFDKALVGNIEEMYKDIKLKFKRYETTNSNKVVDVTIPMNKSWSDNNIDLYVQGSDTNNFAACAGDITVTYYSNNSYITGEDPLDIMLGWTFVFSPITDFYTAIGHYEYVTIGQLSNNSASRSYASVQYINYSAEAEYVNINQIKPTIGNANYQLVSPIIP